MESLFYVYFRKWCSRVNQITFHDYRKELQNCWFPGMVHLASTRTLALESSFHYYFRVCCVLVLTKFLAFHGYRKKCKIIDSQQSFIWPARIHYFGRLLGAPGGSWGLPGRPWQLLVAPDGSGSSWLLFGPPLAASMMCCEAKTRRPSDHEGN